jgi:methylglyoxal reductase
LLAGWRPLTEKYDCTLAQLAIAWTAARPGVTSVLCGARRSQQALENAAAGEIVLAPEDLQTMCQDVESLGQPSPGE